MVATALVHKLLDFPSYTQMSLAELSDFTCVFSECMSLLDGLKIPDVGSFILFTLAFGRLPLHTRKLFETKTTTDFPSMNDLLKFVKSCVVVLEIVGDQPRKANATSLATKAELKPGSYGTQFRKGGDRVRKAGPPNVKSSFVTTGLSKACPCCAESHALDSCNRIKAWSVDDRVQWLREKKLCFICLSAEHWANKCRSKYRCTECKRWHHDLIHKSSSNDDPQHVCASAAALISKSNSVVLRYVLTESVRCVCCGRCVHANKTNCNKLRTCLTGHNMRAMRFNALHKIEYVLFSNPTLCGQDILSIIWINFFFVFQKWIFLFLKYKKDRYFGINGIQNLKIG